MFRKPRLQKNQIVEQLRRAVRGYAVRIGELDPELLLPVIDLEPFAEVCIEVDDGDVSVT